MSIWQSLQYALPLFTGLALQALHHIDFPSFLLRSDRNWSRTHEEKLGFPFANSQVVASNVTFIGLILLASIILLIDLCARIAKKRLDRSSQT